jgi:hypothetical protein
MCEELPPSNNLVVDAKCLLADSHSILNTWKNYCSQLLNVRCDGNARQTDIYTSELLILVPSSFRVEIFIEDLLIVRC